MAKRSSLSDCNTCRLIGIRKSIGPLCGTGWRGQVLAIIGVSATLDDRSKTDAGLTVLKTLHAINSVCQKIRNLGSDAIFRRYIQRADQVPPRRKRVGLVKFEQPPRIADIAMSGFKCEVDGC